MAVAVFIAAAHFLHTNTKEPLQCCNSSFFIACFYSTESSDSLNSSMRTFTASASESLTEGQS